MIPIKQTQLRKRLDTAIKHYIYEFEKKHGCELEHAVNDDLLNMLCFGDNFFSISNVVYDIDNNLEKGLIFRWQDDGLRYNFDKPHNEHLYINLNSYAMGLRYDT